MPCPKCLKQKGYHSYIHFGKLNEINLFYTAPAKSLDKDEDGTKLENIILHVHEETGQKPWIWVLDCGNMTFEHYTEMHFNRGIVDLISTDPWLKEVWIVRSNLWIQTTVAFFQTFSYAKIFSNIFYIDDYFLRLRGLDAPTTNWLLQQ
jgi:hypothetical protein